MVIKFESNKGIDAVCEDLQQAIVNRKFGVVATLNMKETMAKKGVDFSPECRIYEVCHPGHAKTVLTQNMDISTALPCRISIYEENGQVILSTIDPKMMLGMFGSEGLADVAEEVGNVLVESMKEAAG